MRDRRPPAGVGGLSLPTVIIILVPTPENMKTPKLKVNGHEVMSVQVFDGKRYFFTRRGIYVEETPRCECMVHDHTDPRGVCLCRCHEEAL